jgi:acyl dehydratase
MPRTRCLTTDQLEVGMTHEVMFVFTHEQVAQYCALVGDMNAIHHDVEAARLRFPDVEDIIVPGGLLQACITGVFGSSFPGDGSLGLTLRPERMRKPVCPGDSITVTFEVTRLRGEIAEFTIKIMHGLSVKTQSAARVCSILLLCPPAAADGREPNNFFQPAHSSSERGYPWI